jgi:hypothetical protein
MERVASVPACLLFFGLPRRAAKDLPAARRITLRVVSHLTGNPMNASAAPTRRRAVWTTVVVLLVLLASVGAGVWYVQSQLGARPDGARVTLVMPGGIGRDSVVSRSTLPIVVAADLAADGVKSAMGGMSAEREQSFIFRREKATMQIHLTAGNQLVDPALLGYVLIDADGNALSAGAFQPAKQIGAGQTGIVQIVDPDVAEAARVDIRKLP